MNDVNEMCVLDTTRRIFIYIIFTKIIKLSLSRRSLRQHTFHRVKHISKLGAFAHSKSTQQGTCMRLNNTACLSIFASINLYLFASIHYIIFALFCIASHESCSK